MNSCVVKNIILVSKNGTEKKLTLENDKNSQQYLPVMFSIIYIYIYSRDGKQVSCCLGLGMVGKSVVVLL